MTVREGGPIRVMEFKWTFKDPCKKCLVKVMCRDNWNCDYKQCHIKTWDKVKKYSHPLALIYVGCVIYLLVQFIRGYII